MSYIQNTSSQLILISVCSFLLHSITNGEKEKRVISMLSGLFIIVFVINSLSPLIGFIKENEFFPNDAEDEVTSDIYTESFIQAASAELCRSVKLLIINRFSLNETDFSVTVTLDTDDIEAISPTLITIIMNVDTDSATNLMIAEYISDSLATPTVIIEK